MNTVALVSDAVSLPIDYDMCQLFDACQAVGIDVEVCFWDDADVNWSCYSLVVLRSPWTYVDRLPEFLSWCSRTSEATRLLNPLSAIRWSLDKRYLRDLELRGVPVVPTVFVQGNQDPQEELRAFHATHPHASEVVVKPSVGAYSKDVRRFSIHQEGEAVEHMRGLLTEDREVLIQPYFGAIDKSGETDIIYFDGQYSHAIRKTALLLPNGTTIAPTQDTRQARSAGEDEKRVASAALEATAAHLGIDGALLYARVDLIRNNVGDPVVLELELCEPSLSLPFTDRGAFSFAKAINERLVRGNTVPFESSRSS